MKKVFYGVLGVLAVMPALLSLYSWRLLPAQMRLLWHTLEGVQQTVPRTVGASVLPIGALLIALLAILIPRLFGRRIVRIRTVFFFSVTILLLFVLSMHMVFLLSNIHPSFEASTATPAIVGVLLIALGYALGVAQRSWFTSVRSARVRKYKAVWDRTHVLSGGLFIVSGLFAFGAIIFPEYMAWFLILPILLTGLISYAYTVYLTSRIA